MGLCGVKRIGVGLAALALTTGCAYAAGGGMAVNLGSGDSAGYLRLVVLFGSISLAPALLAVLTSFTRIILVLFFLRAGLGGQNLLPNPVLMGLAMLLTVVSMSGTIRQVNETALQPLLAGKITSAEAGRLLETPLRAHLSAHTRPEDLALLTSTHPASAGQKTAAKPALADLATAYVLSELRAAFLIGFVVTLPFLVIDLVVGGTLASIGLASLPQAAVALPFKILLFVMVDGWRLLAQALLTSLQ